MTEFTAEQEMEIQKRIEKAKQEQKELEQYRIAGDQFWRLALANTALLVNNGTCSKFVYEVAQNEYRNFLRAFFPEAAQAPDQKPEGAADEDQQE